ncbi:MAG: hypothetical protein B6241_13505, partial [Spirochaetaceae bacterium 4572_59]
LSLGIHRKGQLAGNTTSLLLPYVDGYATVCSHIKLDHHEMSELLADTVWNLLKEKREYQSFLR